MRTIAKHQLARAIALATQEGDYLCALTLAGAAEEILGKIGSRRNGSTALHESAIWWGQLGAVLGRTAPEKKKVFVAMNRARNQAKHNDGGRDKRLRHDWEFEALNMIDRALRNYELAFGRMPSERIFSNYIEHYWM
jgi:hypothetical protein